MKILVSAYACDPSRGGEFNNGWNYASNVSDDREIWCVTTTEGKASIAHLLRESPIPNLHMVYVEVPAWLYQLKIKSPQLGVYFHYLYWQYKAYQTAKVLDLMINFDVVHHATYASLQLGSFMWKLDKPLLFGPVGGGQVAPRSFKKYFYRWWMLERFRDWIGFLLLNVFNTSTKALKKANLTLVVNQDTYDLAKNYGAGNIKYAPCTLLPDSFSPLVVPERNPGKVLRVLWVGRLLARKGLRIVLEAVSKISQEVPLQLTIIGDGALEKELPDWIQELKLTSSVQWLGRQPLQKVKEAYAEHDVFIYCSLRESLAAQFFESMSFGLPLIILDLHGAKTFIPDDVGIKVPVSTPDQTVEAVGRAIKFMHENSETRKRMGVRAFETAKQFTRSNRLANINQYYKELV